MVRETARKPRANLLRLSKLLLGLLTVILLWSCITVMSTSSFFDTLSTPRYTAKSSSLGSYFYPSIMSNGKANVFIPVQHSGVAIDENNCFNTGVTYDNPFLSILFWVQINSHNTDEKVSIIANREIECIDGQRSMGYSIFYETKTKKLILEWRSKSSKCDVYEISSNIPLDKWFHVAVVFQSNDKYVDDIFDDIVYPLSILVYINGQVTGISLSTRFISGENNSLWIGKTPNGYHLFKGRLFYFMIIGHSLTFEEISYVFKGNSVYINKLKEEAAFVMATDYYDMLSVLKEGESEMTSDLSSVKEHSIYKNQSIDISSRYIANSVFQKPVKTPQIKQGKSGIAPLPVWKDHLTKVKESLPLPILNGDIELYVASLQGKTEEVKDNMSLSVPDTLINDYHTLSEYRAYHIRDCFEFAWANYIDHAWGHDEICPKSGKYRDNWGGIGLTIIDAMDTLLLMGFKQNLEKTKSWIGTIDFNTVADLSVSEMGSRVLGGLLSLYDLTKQSVYLVKSLEIADRLPVINIKTGVSKFQEGNPFRVTLSEIGSILLEFNRLSAVSKSKKYSTVVNKLFDSLKTVQTLDGLLPNYLSVKTGKSADSHYSMSSKSHRYYESLLKLWIQGGKKDTVIQRMYNDAVDGMTKHLIRTSKSGLKYIGEKNGANTGNVMGLSECFIGAMLSLGALHNINPITRDRDIINAKKLTYTCMQLYLKSSTDQTAERYRFDDAGISAVENIDAEKSAFEFVESLYYLNQITGDPIYREWGWDIWKSVEKKYKTKFGFDHLKNGTPSDVIDFTDTNFFARTMKYFYLLFKDDRIIDFTEHVLNSEAHPMKINVK